MSLTVVKRPEGYVLDTTAVSATVTSSSGALFTKVAHGLVTGDHVYIYSILSAYNGYWYVNKVSNDTFRIREYATASDQAFVNSGTVTYYVSATTHTWNCAHLPIVYKIKSDVWPVNAADTARTITTFSNYNGYTYIVASGDIKATGTASSLEQVILTGTSVDGVYKILQWFSDTNFVINLAYSAANVLSSGTVQYYYYNYCAIVQVYAGLPSGHSWELQKPYELVAELSLIPDSSGIITVNIADYVKKQIEIISNNNLLDTLPNNIDAWCSFYISVAESYDDSNGYTVSTYTSSFATDAGSFEGYAANAKLPFKNRAIGTLSQYFYGGTTATQQKWLTTFSRPSLFAGKYFDISYINSGSVTYVQRKVYIRGVLKETYNDTVTGYDEGIYRYSVAQSGWNEDTITIALFNVANVQMSELLTIDVVTDCSYQDFYLVWLNYLGGYDYWNFTARKEYLIDVLESKTQEENIYANWPNSYGEFADSINKQTLRRSKNSIAVNSQFLTSAQEDAIKLIFTSPLVQIVTSQYDRFTVIVDAGSMKVKKDQDKTRTLNFLVRYTDENPSQSL